MKTGLRLKKTWDALQEKTREVASLKRQVAKLQRGIPTCYVTSTDEVHFANVVAVDRKRGRVIYADGGWNNLRDCFFTPSQYWRRSRAAVGFARKRDRLLDLANRLHNKISEL